MRVVLCFACCIAIGLFHPLRALSQDVDAPDADDSNVVEEIIVTGSRIPRSDFFSLSPIVSVDRQEIALTGNLQINYLLNSLPQVDPGLGAGTGNTNEGTSRINLRGLGDFRTLTLLNGRRYANSGIFGATDLNSLPPVMIERVEVITGGASAVYGSDAIAGAVNFILRNDFEGFETSLQYGVTDRSDAESYNIDVAYGTAFASGDGHVAASSTTMIARPSSRMPERSREIRSLQTIRPARSKTMRVFTRVRGPSKASLASIFTRSTRTAALACSSSRTTFTTAPPRMHFSHP